MRNNDHHATSDVTLEMRSASTYRAIAGWRGISNTATTVALIPLSIATGLFLGIAEVHGGAAYLLGPRPRLLEGIAPLVGPRKICSLYDPLSLLTLSGRYSVTRISMATDLSRHSSSFFTRIRLPCSYCNRFDRTMSTN